MALAKFLQVIGVTVARCEQCDRHRNDGSVAITFALPPEIESTTIFRALR